MDSPFDTLRRSFENTIANWPLLLMKLAEGIAAIGLIILVIAVSVVPLIWAGVSLSAAPPGDTFEDFLRWLGASWPLFIVVFLAATVLVLVLVGIHSFVQAATSGVLVDGQRKAGPELLGDRKRYAAFDAESWFAHGRRHWWTVFLIYNVVWGVAGIVMLLPLIPTAVVAWWLRDSDGIWVAGCLGLAVTLGVVIVASIIATIWSNLAIVAAVARNLDTLTSIREGGRIFRVAIADVVIVVVGLWAISAAAGMLFVAMHMSISAISMIPFAGFITLPFQIGASFVQNAISLFVGIWMMAAFATIIVREHSKRESSPL
jgi:hypothetical protein